MLDRKMHYTRVIIMCSDLFVLLPEEPWSEAELGLTLYSRLPGYTSGSKSDSLPQSGDVLGFSRVLAPFKGK